jgi:hypothetical protein
MVEKVTLNSSRIRRIKGGFSFIPHRFLTGGFWNSLSPDELLLYFFLVLAGDRNGLSFYSYDKICTLLKMQLDRYIQARDGLLEKDLIAFDGTLYQVLSLPVRSVSSTVKKRPSHKSRQPEVVGNILKKIFVEASHG